MNDIERSYLSLSLLMPEVRKTHEIVLQIPIELSLLPVLVWKLFLDRSACFAPLSMQLTIFPLCFYDVINWASSFISAPFSKAS
jgi:hypothetical protein